MSTVPVSMTLPADLAQALRAKVAAGEIKSMSSYAANAITERLERETTAKQSRARVESYLSRYLVEPDEESEAFVADVLAGLEQKAHQA